MFFSLVNKSYHNIKRYYKSKTNLIFYKNLVYILFNISTVFLDIG